MSGFRASSGFSCNSGSSSVTSITMTIPTGVVSTDNILIVLTTATSTASPHSLTSTTGSGSLSVPSGGLSGQAIGTSYAVTTLLGTGHVAGDVLTFATPGSGITTGAGGAWDNSVTFDTCGTALTSAGTSTQTVPSVTTSAANCIVVCVCVQAQTSTRSFSSVTPATDEFHLNGGGGNTRWTALSLSDQTITSAGASGTNAVTFSGNATGSAGIQISLKPAAASFTGSASQTETASITAAGKVGAVTTASLAPNAGITTTGVVGASSTASSTATVGTTSTGVVGTTTTTTTTTVTVGITAAGTVGTPGSLTGTSSQTATVGITTAGQVGTVASATLTATAGRTAAGIVGTSNTATLTATVGITAAGSVASASPSAPASLTATVSVSASGVVGAVSTATLSITTATTADGLATQPSYRYAPPSRKEYALNPWPLRVHVRTSTTVYRIGGVWHNVSTPGMGTPNPSDCDVASTGLLCYFNTPVNVPLELHDGLLAIVPADPSWLPGTLTPL